VTCGCGGAVFVRVEKEKKMIYGEKGYLFEEYEYV